MRKKRNEIGGVSLCQSTMNGDDERRETGRCLYQSCGVVRGGKLVQGEGSCWLSEGRENRGWTVRGLCEGWL